VTRRLILMRHAKSSWGHPGLSDHARPLNSRGQRASRAMGAWLAQKGYVPDQVLSSDSQRTRETWAGLAPDLPGAPQPDWRGDLYHASEETMLRALRGASGKTVLLLGHNPGCAFFADQIVQAPPPHDRFDDYPTAATLVAQFDVPSWSEAQWGAGRVLDFVVPRELEG
jgi:phosphohistidine phosphatase